MGGVTSETVSVQPTAAMGASGASYLTLGKDPAARSRA